MTILSDLPFEKHEQDELGLQGQRTYAGCADGTRIVLRRYSETNGAGCGLGDIVYGKLCPAKCYTAMP